MSHDMSAQFELIYYKTKYNACLTIIAYSMPIMYIALHFKKYFLQFFLVALVHFLDKTVQPPYHLFTYAHHDSDFSFF